MTYFVFMAENNWLPSDLINIRQDWENPLLHDVVDSYGQQWASQLYHQQSKGATFFVLFSRIMQLVARLSSAFKAHSSTRSSPFNGPIC